MVCCTIVCLLSNRGVIMTKGIRDAVAEAFIELLPSFQAGEKTGTEFRKAVMDVSVQRFGTSVASAATHYNFALKSQRANDPESVAELGRSEDKKGGRKPIHVVTVIKVKTGEVVATGISKEKANLMITVANSTKGKAKLKLQEPEVTPEAVTA